jgi:NADPH:quinone reductase-like Zn-dependent oxidoreductase
MNSIQSNSKMNAFICTAYGDSSVLQLSEVDKPTPSSNEILVKIKAIGITSGDVRIRSSKFPKGFKTLGRLALGISKPRNPILGSEFSGIVEEVGSAVKVFKKGDEVLGFRVGGIYAEYACIKEEQAIVKKPANLNFTEAAGLSFGGTTALFFLNLARIASGEKVLINGASGAVGSFAVQLAKNFGANVTGVCSTDNLDLVQSFGADNVIDYKKENVLEKNETYDIILDTVGNLSFEDCEEILNENGRFLPTAAPLGDMIFKSSKKLAGNKRFITGTAGEKKEEIQLLANLATEGKIKPFIDKEYPFEQLPGAHAYVETGRKRGVVVVTLN